MAEVLKQRVDILTTKLHKPTSPDTADDLASNVLHLHPSTTPATPTLVPPSYLRTLMSKEGRETHQDLVDVQAEPLLLSTCFQDGETLPWSPSWELPNPNLGTHIESQPQGRAGQWVSRLLDDPWPRSNRAPFNFLSGEQGGHCPDNGDGDNRWCSLNDIQHRP